MIWLLLWIIWTFFAEINSSISKHKLKKHDILKLWVISSFFWMMVFLWLWIYKFLSSDLTLNFNPDSIPLLSLRVFLEIVQSYFTILAIKHADRSTFSIIRIITIPLLVIADILLWYTFTNYSLIWILIILLSFIIFNTKIKTINLKWGYYVLFTAVNAVFTLSLFKYSITTYGNSVEVDQFIVILSTLLFFIAHNHIKKQECAIKLLIKEKIFLLLWITIWISMIVLSYSYLYLNTSEATAIKRAGEMLWSILFWFYYWKEDNFIKKLLFATCIIIWLVLMIQ